MHVSMEMVDGTVYEAVANPKTFNGMATKAAFKKQFGVPQIVMSLWAKAMGPDGLDLSQLSDDQVGHLDEQHLAFMVWCELRRRLDDVPDGPWDELVELIVDIEIDSSSEDPT